MPFGAGMYGHAHRKWAGLSRNEIIGPAATDRAGQEITIHPHILRKTQLFMRQGAREWIRAGTKGNDKMTATEKQPIEPRPRASNGVPRRRNES